MAYVDIWLAVVLQQEEFLYQPLKTQEKQTKSLFTKYISGSTYEYLLLYPFDRGYELVMGIQRDEGTVSSGAWFQWRSLEYR